MSTAHTRSKIILFTCSWQAYSSQVEAGRLGLARSTDVIPIRLSCLGRISSGMIIKAFQDGAAGVCLLGCPDGECRYLTGNQQAERVYLETKQLLNLLGYSQDQLQFHRIPAGVGERFNEILERMLQDIAKEREGI